MIINPKLYNPYRIRSIDVQHKYSKDIIKDIDRNSPLIELIKLEKNSNDDELIYLKFELEISNKPKNGIKEFEEILILVTNDDRLPFVYALREGFNKGLPHTNYTNFDSPISLCIFEDTFIELKHKWSGTFFLNSIKKWLELTAKDELHQSDQPPEPFIHGNNIVIIQKGFNHIEKLDNNIYRLTPQESNKTKYFNFSYVEIKCVENNIVYHSIDTLYDLVKIYNEHGVDFLFLIKKEIKSRIDSLLKGKHVNSSVFKHEYFIAINSPYKFNGNINQNIFLVKLKQSFGDLCYLLGYNLPFNFKNITTDKLDEIKSKSIKIEIISNIYDFDIESAREYSTISNDKFSQPNVSLIGCGALGSHFFMNLAKSGLGKWTLIDNDVLLPHNLTKHSSIDRINAVSEFKAKIISSDANKLLNSEVFSKPINKNIFDVDPLSIPKSDIIIDISTSIGVQRYLTKVFKENTKYTAFLNPTGTGLVLLTDDISNNITLDLLEYQYYSELINNQKLNDFLNYSEETKIRYARGCRDITSKISQEDISIFSGILSKFFKSNHTKNEARLNIWLLDENYTIHNYNFKIIDWTVKEINEWKIYISNVLIDKLKSHRVMKLPVETGGILLGGVDKLYKKIYLTDSILSPADSIEKPYNFIRGIDNVSSTLNKVSKITNEFVYYMGEWHSHPKGSSVSMSQDDIIQFEQLKDDRRISGEPVVMIILGDNGFNIKINV